LRRVLDPNLAEGYNNRGTAKSKLDLKESAEEDHRKGIELGFTV